MDGRIGNAELVKESAYLAAFRCREIYGRNRCHSRPSERTDVMNVPSPEP